MNRRPRPFPRQTPTRRGFTLRELGIAMTLGSTVMMIAVSMVHRAFDWSTTAQFRRLDDQTFFQLGRQFRGDVHSATNSQLGSGDVDQMTLTLPDASEVVYQIRPQSVIRTRTLPDESNRREVFRFKQPRKFWFHHLEDRQQIALRGQNLTPFAPETVPIWRSLRATVGLRLKHQRGEIDP